MAAVGNLIWVLIAGWVLALAWLLAAVVSAISIVLLPMTPATLKLALFSLLPFGRELVDKRLLDGRSTRVDQTTRGSLNIIWLVLVGWWLALFLALYGIVLCLTVIGFPFGVQAFKLAGAALWPFGKEVVVKEVAKEAKLQSARDQIATRRQRA